MQREEKHWARYERLQELTQRETGMLALLERFEQGEAAPEEVVAAIPAEADEEKPHQSKRKRAIERQRQEIDRKAQKKAGYVDVFGDEWKLKTEGTIKTSAPNDNGTGRNLRRVRGSDITEEDFFEKTADTHGGKVAAHRKSSTFVGRGGRKIRRY